MKKLIKVKRCKICNRTLTSRNKSNLCAYHLNKSLHKKTAFKIFKKDYELNPNGLKGDYFSKGVANTRHLTRIIVSLKMFEKARFTDLGESLVGGMVSLPDALNWLVNNKIICQKKLNRGIFYSINKKWEKLKNE